MARLSDSDNSGHLLEVCKLGQWETRVRRESFQRTPLCVFETFEHVNILLIRQIIRNQKGSSWLKRARVIQRGEDRGQEYDVIRNRSWNCKGRRKSAWSL